MDNGGGKRNIGQKMATGEKNAILREELLRLIAVCYPNMPKIASNLGDTSSLIGKLSMSTKQYLTHNA
jgi:hypothetical protein